MVQVTRHVSASSGGSPPGPAAAARRASVSTALRDSTVIRRAGALAGALRIRQVPPSPPVSAAERPQFHRSAECARPPEEHRRPGALHRIGRAQPLVHRPAGPDAAVAGASARPAARRPASRLPQWPAPVPGRCAPRPLRSRRTAHRPATDPPDRRRMPSRHPDPPDRQARHTAPASRPPPRVDIRSAPNWSDTHASASGIDRRRRPRSARARIVSASARPSSG